MLTRTPTGRPPLKMKCFDLSSSKLEQIHFLLGHVSIQTTGRYLGCKQRFVVL
jgi:hypothetical protein